MRKLLITLLLLVLIALLAGMIIIGLDVGNTKIGYSVQEILDKNEELDKSILNIDSRIKNEYMVAQADLDASFSNLQAEKQKYQKTIAYTSEEDLESANKTEEYKLNYLWTNIGLYATKNNVAMKADLSYGTSGVSNQYNIAFTAVGEYLSIAEFIYAIEKDASLGFRIEEFALVPSSDNYLQATFIVKNVAIDPNSLSASASVTSGTVTDNTTSDNIDG